ncbi:hypothetical protein AB0C04_26265 [Micromonospora sp. NPDC048909]|uniref:hypothetical protein n=1 Tax=Micromonospora sp. NPDC048909 TaxID=3155643 RepID=UPI0033D7BAF4
MPPRRHGGGAPEHGGPAPDVAEDRRWPALPDPAGAGEVGRTAAGVGRRGAPPGGPWPALPDDRPLWTTPGDAPDAAHLRRLEREQAGG